MWPPSLWTPKDVKGAGERSEVGTKTLMSTRSPMQGDRNPGGKARRESGRETEGDRRRKSLRHG